MEARMGWVVLAATIAGCGTEGAQVGPIKIASSRFEFEDAKVDASCTEPHWRLAGGVTTDTDCGGLFDYCVRTHAGVQSLADTTQTATVYAKYTTPDGKEVRKTQSVTLGPGTTQDLTFTFEEASIGDDKPNVEVVIDARICTRLTCNVTNTGDAAGTASVEAAYDGATRTDQLNLAPGQTRTLTYDFPGALLGGQAVCRLSASQ
jgi:hypothetical protein